MSPLIEAKNISKVVQQADRNIEILNNVTLHLNAGESLAIMGASGKGKSTLLHILGTLDVPSSGDLLLLGKTQKKRDLPLFRNQHMGFVFQNFYLLEDDSVLNNILTPARIAKKEISIHSEAYHRAIELIQCIGLSHHTHSYCSHLSGGEKQRVAIARALMNNPSILLADEPSGNLDDRTSECIHNLLLSQVTSSRGLLVVTHNKYLANQCDRIGVLKNGGIIF